MSIELLSRPQSHEIPQPTGSIPPCIGVTLPQVRSREFASHLTVSEWHQVPPLIINNLVNHTRHRLSPGLSILLGGTWMSEKGFTITTHQTCNHLSNLWNWSTILQCLWLQNYVFADTEVGTLVMYKILAVISWSLYLTIKSCGNSLHR